MEAQAQLAPGGQRPKLLAHIRRERVLDALARTGAVSVGDVASQLGVSEMTVRRDLVELEKEGKLVRTHGGAVPLVKPR